MIVDTSALLAYFDRAEPDHAAVSAVIDTVDSPLVVSPYVVAGLDYAISRRIGATAELAALRELAGGAWDLPEFALAELRLAVPIVEKFRAQAVSVTDASNVVLAHRYRTQEIATLDHQHFETLRPLGGGQFRVLP